VELSASNRRSLLALIDQFSRQSVVVLGDLVADEYVRGEISRVSREAPVLILKQEERKIVPGGGANAANNLATLECKVHLAGFAGEDEPGEALLAYFRERGVVTDRIVRPPRYVTPTKSRILGGLGHGHAQQIVRVDREPEAPPLPRLRHQLTESVLSELAGSSAVLLSDYGYGSTAPGEAQWIRSRLHSTLPVTADARYNLMSYRKVTATTPNEPEIEAAFGARIGNDTGLLSRLAARVLRACALQALLITRGREGVALFESGAPSHFLPIFGSDQVADVTGAGDTVIAAFTLALAAKASFLHAAMLANCAGGLVVMKSGTATVTRSELREAIRNA
jgi:D-glycero-beta-D-manno-heptose-7-phosphate kinase